MHDRSQLYAGIAALAFAAVIVRRTLRPQVVRVWALVAAPAVLCVFAGLILAHSPPDSTAAVLVLVAGGVTGAILGYARGVHSKVKLGPQPRTIVVEGNGVLVAILLAAYAARVIMRATIGNAGPLTLALSDAFLIFAVASVAVARGMLFLTWRRLSSAAGTTAIVS